ncbi:hypothetical protein JW933_00195 [candidate division FCPU426 bacterium]|nr:hypothetical protein [candidate division FCPU426 bacterium]
MKKYVLCLSVLCVMGTAGWQPPVCAAADRVLFGARHASLSSWRDEWPDSTPTGAKIEVAEGQAKIVGTNTDLFYGMVYQMVEDWDLDKTPYLEINITACNSDWYMVVSNPNIEAGYSKADYIKLQKGTQATGLFAFDVREATGLQGTRTIRLEIGIATSERPGNKGLSLKFSSLKLVGKSRGKIVKVELEKSLSQEEEEELERASAETQLLGWSNREPNGGSSGAHLEKQKDGSALLVGDFPKQSYGYASKEMTVDFAEFTKLEVVVKSVEYNLYVIFAGDQFRGGYHRFPYIYKPGTYIFDLKNEFKYLSGPQKFILKVGITTENMDIPNKGKKAVVSSIKFIGTGTIQLALGLLPSQLIEPPPPLAREYAIKEDSLPATLAGKQEALEQGGILSVFGKSYQAEPISFKPDAPRFSEAGPALTVSNKYYEVQFNKESGVFESVKDKIHGAEVGLGTQPAYLWRIMFKDGVFLNSGDFLKQPGAEYSYRWLDKENTLRFTTKRGPTTMQIDARFGGTNYFDFSAVLKNGEDQVVVAVETPKISFDYDRLDRLYLPWYMGVSFNQRFFKNKRRWKTTYPFLFADLVNWAQNDGGCFSSFLLWAGKPVAPSRINIGYSVGKRGLYEHVWTTYIRPQEQWEAQALRMTVGEKVETTLRRFKRDNQLENSPLVADKLGKDLFEKVKQGVLLKISMDSNRNFAHVNTYFKELPYGTIVHFVTWWLEGFDKHMPDFWPVDPTYGTNQDFKDSIALAQKNNLLVMPYTNPTFWNESPTLTKAGGPDEIGTRDLKGELRFEVYPSGGKGWAASPRHPAVVETGDHIARKFFKEYGIDILFLDQIGARFIYYDLNKTMKNPTGYSEAWLQNSLEYLKLGPLFTEQGYDRLIPIMASFSGLASFSAPPSYDYDNYFGAGNWEYFPMAQYLSHENVIFMNHNLAHEVFCESHDRIAWYLAHGYHMLNGRWISGWPSRKRWFYLADQIQKHVVAKYTGQPLLNYRQPEPSRLFYSAYPDLGILANISDTQEYDILNHTVSRNGFIATNESGSFLAGRFSRLYGFALTTDQYLVIERNEYQMVVYQLEQYPNTLLTLPRPAEWKYDEAITVRQGAKAMKLVATTPQTVSFLTEGSAGKTGTTAYEINYNHRYQPEFALKIVGAKLNAARNTQVSIGLEAKNLGTETLLHTRLSLSAWLVKRNAPLIDVQAGYKILGKGRMLISQEKGSLGPGKTVSTVFPFLIPANAEVGDIIWLRGELVSKSDGNIRTMRTQSIVKVIPLFDIQMPTEQKSLSVGEWKEFAVTVKNNFTQPVNGKVTLNVPDRWKGNKSKTLALKPEESRRVLFKVMPPQVQKRVLAPVSVSYQVKKKVVEAAAAELEVAPVWRVISVEGPRLLVPGRKSKAVIRLIANGNLGVEGKVELKPGSGLEVSRQEMVFDVPPGGEQALEFEILANKNKKSDLEVEVTSPRGREKVRVPYETVTPGQARVVSGNLLNRGDHDIILANSEVEVQLQKEMGGRVMSFYLRKTGSNMLYQNYPKVEQRAGEKDWVEYGGINDWFPGGWPGEVWNGPWEAEVITADGPEAVVKMWTKTDKGLKLERTMTLAADSRRLRLDYEVTNLTGGSARYQWFNHPDLAPGPKNFAGEFHRMIIPVADNKDPDQEEVLQEKFIAKIDKDTYVPHSGWVVALDSQSQDYFMQVFNPEEITQIGVWQDSNFYTMELLGKDEVLKPAESKKFTIFYIAGNKNWEEEL